MKVYNTLTRKKEEFVPLDPNEVKIYVCGPTVYNFFHIGNARPFVVFDTLRRYMEYRGYHVKFVQNFTDVDDKIINRAREEGLTAPEVAEKYIGEYFRDAASLNVKPASVHPKVSEHIGEIIDFVKTLIEKGYAYEASGDVYFSTRRLHGNRRGEWEGRAGILNAQRCPKSISERRLIFMPADRICSFRIMRMRLPSPNAATVCRLPDTGCTMDILRLITKR